MHKLSVAIITLNEELNIERCLESVKTVADEIVVVDSFSTDNTHAICKRHGVRFSAHPFEGHIQQKNHALSLCSHPYVLSMDADEALSPRLTASILSEKEKGFADGYTLNRLNNYYGKWVRLGGCYPDRKMRLVRKEWAIWSGTNPHDKLIITHKQAQIKHLKGDLLHYTILSLDEHRKAVDYYAEIGAKALFEKGTAAPWLLVYLSPLAKFFQSYILLLGFLEGSRGWHIARLSSKGKYLKYMKLRKLYRENATEIP